MDLSTEDINPCLITCRYFNGYNLSDNQKLTYRTVYDYEIDYFIKSGGGVIINGEYIKFEPGDINIRKPGQTVCGVLPYECYFLSFDILGNRNKSNGYILGESTAAQPEYKNNLLSSLPNKIAANKASVAGSIIKNIYNDYAFISDLKKFEIKAFTYLLVNELFCVTDRMKPENASDKIISDIVTQISENYWEQINITDLIKKSGLSKAHFHKCFKKFTGMTPGSFITKFRIEKAKSLLSVTGSNISEVAMQCGYYDNVYFSCIFKKETGLTPTSYRKHHLISV